MHVSEQYFKLSDTTVNFVKQESTSHATEQQTANGSTIWV
jgi:hypothetical protein